MFDDIEKSLSPEVKAALPYLMIGGGGAALGGFASGARHAKDGESRLGYAGRLARNMALAGALAGGGAYALHTGYQGLNNSIDHDNPMTGSDPAANPVAEKIRGLAFSPLTAGAAGVGTLAATNGGWGKANTGLAKEYEDNRAKALKEVLPGSKDVDALRNATKSDIAAALAKDPERKIGIDRILQKGGISTGEAEGANKAYQLLERAYRPTAGRLLGQHVGWPSVGRASLALGAALTPTLLGSLFTNPENPRQ